MYQAWPWMRSFITSAGPSGIPTPQSVDYMRNFTSAVPEGRLVMLDMRCECEPVYARTESLYGTSFSTHPHGPARHRLSERARADQRMLAVQSSK